MFLSCTINSCRDRNPDLLEPSILRSLVNVKITSVHTSCASCHFVAIDIDGDAWLFGRNGSSCLGISGEEYISENAPRLLKASELGAAKGTKFVYAACGRNHTLLVGSDGSVWSAGVNNLGQVRSPYQLSMNSPNIHVVWSFHMSRSHIFQGCQCHLQRQ